MGDFDGEEFGQAIVESIKTFVNARCGALETKITRLEAMLEQRNFSYHGVWKEGKVYSPGQFVTFGGGLWHSNVFHNASQPGNGDAAWTLAVKAGRNGKDGRDAPAQG